MMIRRLYELGAVILVSLLLVTVVTHLWEAEWHIPFFYTSGDAFKNEAVFKSIIDHGTYLHNPNLGAPGELEYYDFPRTEHVQILIGRILALFFQDYAILINLFFILTFPIAAAVAFLVLRSFGISFPSAFASSLLYTFIPYHFVRGQTHFFLACYFFVPLSIVMCLWICRGETLLTRNAKGKLCPTSYAVAATIFCLLIASSGTYYTFFSCFLILISGIYALLQTRRWNSFVFSIFLIFVLFVGAIANLVPVILYQQREGKNEDVAERTFAEAELYGLKLNGLLLPASGHRFPPLSKLMRKYPPAMLKENHSAYLGIVGVTGFFVLLGWLFFPRIRLKDEHLTESLSVFNGSLILLGVTGGFGIVFAFLVFSQFRAYNRVSIFLAFLALFAIALILDRFRARHQDILWKRRLTNVLPFIILVFGIWDQTIPAYYVKKPKQISDFHRDALFVRQIEEKIPAGSMIFQLPYHPFPEAGGNYRMKDYDHLRGYLHSSKLRWSYAAMRGRKWDLWQRETVSFPIPKFIKTLREAGFRGLYFDRFGYSGKDATEDDLVKYLGEPIVASEDNRLWFFLL